jgi:hypothetical protein
MKVRAYILMLIAIVLPLVPLPFLSGYKAGAAAPCYILYFV